MYLFSKIDFRFCLPLEREIVNSRNISVKLFIIRFVIIQRREENTNVNDW